ITARISEKLAKEGKHHDSRSRPSDLRQRTEGAPATRRNWLAIHPRGLRAAVQEYGYRRLSRDEPEHEGADADRRGRRHVGVAYDFAVSRGVAQAAAGGRDASRKDPGRALDGLATGLPQH